MQNHPCSPAALRAAPRSPWPSPLCADARVRSCPPPFILFRLSPCAASLYRTTARVYQLLLYIFSLAFIATTLSAPSPSTRLTALSRAR